MRVRTGHSPDAWSENVPSTAHITPDKFASGAFVIGHMLPVVRGSVLSMTAVRRAQVDAARARFKARHSIIPANRYPDEAA